MTGLPLLDWRPLAVKHSPTSRAAAESIAPTAGTLRAAVLDWLTANGPATDERIADAFPGYKDSTVRARRIELTRAGMVRDTGAKAAGRSGREMAVWGVRGDGGAGF